MCLAWGRGGGEGTTAVRGCVGFLEGEVRRALAFVLGSGAVKVFGVLRVLLRVEYICRYNRPQPGCVISNSRLLWRCVRVCQAPPLGWGGQWGCSGRPGDGSHRKRTAPRVARLIHSQNMVVLFRSSFLVYPHDIPRTRSRVNIIEKSERGNAIIKKPNAQKKAREVGTDERSFPFHEKMLSLGLNPNEHPVEPLSLSPARFSFRFPLSAQLPFT